VCALLTNVFAEVNGIYAYLPSSSPLWILFKEFGRTPLHFQWLALCARFWSKAAAPIDPEVTTVHIELLRASMRDNIRLAISNCNCWVSNFLKCMVQINALTQSDLDACTTVEHYQQLPISEQFVKLKLKAYWASLCDRVFGDVRDPRSMPDDTPITNIRYKAWVDGPAQPPHLTAFLPTHIKHEIIRLRCSSYPLAIQMGRRHRDRIPRSMRLCKACYVKDVCACVEDDKHFLLECPVYESIRSKYENVFGEDATMTSILKFPDQILFGRVLHEMLLLRSSRI